MQEERLTSRITFLDAARAIAACLGIILHTAAGYVKYPVPQWPRFGEKYNATFDYLVCAIHIFRVPIFFFLAGLFSYQLLKKWHFLGFLKNRMKRIVLPFAFFTLLLHLPSLLTKAFSHQIHSFSDLIYTYENVGYLWFLEYLILYYILFLGLICIGNLAGVNRDFFEGVKNTWMQSRWKSLPIIFLTFFFLYMSNVWYTPILLSYVPDIWLLCNYGLYFSLGLLVIGQNEYKHFFTFKWKNVLLGIVVYSTYIYLLVNGPHRETFRIFAVALYSISSYVLFTVFMSVCYTFFTKKNVVIQYLSEASYWIYLSQVFWIGFVYHLAVRYFDSIFSQFAVICLGTLILALLTHLCFSLPAKERRVRLVQTLKS